MPPSPNETKLVVDHLFRHQSGRIVSVLTRLFGIDRMDLAEDVVQEALLKALQLWPYRGIPQNPAGWIMKVARNHALDIVRRDQNLRLKKEQIRASSEEILQNADEPYSEQEIEDDQLRMMFACCHPSLKVESQVPLILKTLCGFGTTEIARAFLSNEEAIHKRLVRAKQKLRGGKVTFEFPDPRHLSARLESVLKALYLLFNEGYKSSSGKDLIRKDLCDEAIRLTGILSQHPSGDQPETHGLLALMLFHGARLSSRTDGLGNLLLLKDQDRETWDGKMIRAAFREIESSGKGKGVSRYQLEAGIAACHCLAPTYADTDWEKILLLYDMLIQVNDSPVITLNRAVALSHVQGPEAGIRAVEEIREATKLDRYYLLYAVLGEFYTATGNHEKAAAYYRKALELTEVRSEKIFLLERLELSGQNLN